MLVLTLKDTEALKIGEDVFVHVKKGRGKKQFKLAIDAPKTKRIARIPQEEM